METRFLARIFKPFRLTPSRCPSYSRNRHSSTNSQPFTQQVHPLGDYYASLLESSTPKISSKPPTTASPSTTPPVSSQPPDDESRPEAGILFSSRLSSPLERRSEIRRKSVQVAGVWLPPRPDEPDNCCMSGCVNCVWDRYGEEVEEWAAARKKVDKALKKQKAEKERPSGEGFTGTGLMLGEGEKGAGHTMVSMDDDGGGSESNWETGLDDDFSSEDLFKGVPVGIREFMKQEKKLKEKHAREAASAGKGI